MSTTPKQSFLKTLGKHLIDPGTPPAAPEPPKTPEPPAPAAPAPEPKPTPPPTPPVEPPAKKEPEAPAPAAPGDAPAPEAPPAAPEPPKPPKKKKSEPLPPVKAEDMAEPAKPAAAPEKKDVAKLLDYTPTKAEVRYLDVLQAAAERDPAQYQPILDREADRLKKVNAFAVKWKAEHPDEELSADTPEYRRFLRENPPAIDGSDHADLRDEMVAERAKRSAKAEIEQDLEPKLRKVVEVEVKPVIAKAEAEIEAALLAAIPEALEKDDLLRDVSKEGLASLYKVPGEGKVFKVAVERGKSVVRTFLRLRNRLEAFDAQNPEHVFISRSVATAAAFFEAEGGDDRIRDGRRFVTPATFAQMKPDAQARHWTFSDADIVETFAAMTARGALDELKEVRDEEKAKAEFRESRKPKAPAVPSGKEPAAPSAPPSPSVSPSPAKPTGTPPPPKNAWLKKTLGVI